LPAPLSPSARLRCVKRGIRLAAIAVPGLDEEAPNLVVLDIMMRGMAKGG